MLLISGTPLSRENEMGQNRDALLATGGKEAAGFGCPSSSHQETNTFNDTNSTNIDHTFLSFMIMGMFFYRILSTFINKTAPSILLWCIYKNINNKYYILVNR